jgi:hypothetical protein
MKKPKNKNYVFLVVRENNPFTQENTPIACFFSLDSAEEYAGKCTQEYLDRGYKDISFSTTPLIYYDN